MNVENMTTGDVTETEEFLRTVTGQNVGKRHESRGFKMLIMKVRRITPEINLNFSSLYNYMTSSATGVNSENYVTNNLARCVYAALANIVRYFFVNKTAKIKNNDTLIEAFKNQVSRIRDAILRST